MKIRLNDKFYSKKAVEQALRDFKNLCEGKILNDSIEIELTPKAKTEMIKEEFCNYVLGLMKA